MGNGIKFNKSNESNESKDNGKKQLYFIVVCGVLLGLLTILIGKYFSSDISTMSKPDDNIVQTDGHKTDYAGKLENQLEEILSKIEGIGKVEAMIYIKEGEKQIPVFNENTSQKNTNEEDVSGGRRETTEETNGNTIVMKNSGTGSEPFISETKLPEITGVVVVCEGIKTDSDRVAITQTICNLFNISNEKVNVHAMKN